MGFLAGKRILLTGLLSNRSIAYGIARACRREGAELAFTYAGERFRPRVTERAHIHGTAKTLELPGGFGPFHRFCAARSDCGRFSGWPDAREFPHHARYFRLQLSSARQSGAAAALFGRFAADAELSGR